MAATKERLKTIEGKSVVIGLKDRRREIEEEVEKRGGGGSRKDSGSEEMTPPARVSLFYLVIFFPSTLPSLLQSPTQVKPRKKNCIALLCRCLAICLYPVFLLNRPF